MQIITTHKNTDFDGLASVIAGTLLYMSPEQIRGLPVDLAPHTRDNVARLELR